jgi:hypothetical protein
MWKGTAMTDVVASSDKYRAVAKKFDEPIVLAKEIGDGLREGLVSIGEPWSAEGMSKEFGEKFPPAMDKLVKAFYDVHEGLTKIQANFRTMATNIDNTENANPQ